MKGKEVYMKRAMIIAALISIGFSNPAKVQADLIDALTETGKLIKESKEAKEKAEEEEEKAPKCPNCKKADGKPSRLYPSYQDMDLFPEFNEIFYCIKCKGRLADGNWYDKDEWIVKLNSILKEREFNRIEHLKSYGWPDEIINRIMDGKISIGDTSEMVREAWGVPEDINRTITAYGTSEQWVYGGGCYVYFENGKVTTIQD
jgi:ribosomal protein L37AE/L43A